MIDPLAQAPVDIAVDQVTDAMLAVDRHPMLYLHLPWSAADVLVGGIAPGDVWFLGGFSGMGKTTLLGSLTNSLFEANKRVYYLGLESRPLELRTQWACRRLGIDPGDALTGKLRQQGIIGETARETLKAELMTQTKGDIPSRIFFSPAKRIGRRELKAAVVHAKSLRSDLLIIDHIDHVADESNGNAYEQSRAVTNDVLDHAHEHGMTMLVATQMNNDASRGDALSVYRPPRPEMVYMGAHKRMVATGMLGLFKPLREGVDQDTMKAAGRGDIPPSEVLMPMTMGLVVMKHRNYGSREGERCHLSVRKGLVTDWSPYSPLR